MGPTNFYTGTCGWSFEDWCGSFYPEYTTKDHFLELYSEHFRAVELGAMARRLPTLETVRRWRGRVPDDFKFAVVAPQVITHEKKLDGIDRELTGFLSLCERLGGKLGPIIFSFPYNFGIEHLADMTRFISSLPDGFAFVIEIKRRRWLNSIFLDHLKEKKISLAHTDLPWMTDAARVFTSPTIYIRCRGRERHNWPDRTRIRIDESAEIAKWAKHAAPRVERGRPTFAFFSNNFAGHAPASAKEFYLSCMEAIGS